MDFTKKMTSLAKAAHKASSFTATLSTSKKNAVLRDMAKALRENVKKILKENQKDLNHGKDVGLSSAMMDRLELTEARVKSMATAILDVVKLPDPVGVDLKKWERPNGLKMSKVSVPLGVVMVIYEARPNVTAECVSLAFKSGNAIILKGGKEAYYSNKVISGLFTDVMKKHSIPAGAVSFVNTTDRGAVNALLELSEYISVVVPRGGEGLIRHVVANSKIPVIKHYKGVCHIFVDAEADVKKASAIAVNAKAQRPGVCNAMETLLVHKKLAKKFLPVCAAALIEAGVELRGCDVTRAILKDKFKVKKATKKDYAAEFLDLILAVKVVSSVEEAIDHIAEYGSGHTEAILTKDKKSAKLFAQVVDASSIMINASTRFSDGNEFGLGAEIGISTDKIHARGPMGLEGLTSYKYVVRGTGQVRP